MKSSANYENADYQRELIRTGTRTQIIEWLCWNDPKGSYLDHECEIGRMKNLSLEQARNLMETRLDRRLLYQSSSVIPSISDRAANEANVAEIDREVRTQRYHLIVAWGKWLGFTPATVRKYVEEAEAENAPTDAIQKIDDRWICLDDIKNELNRQRVIELADNIGGSNS